ncbi:hypothetical protein GC163_20765 [bacterium]|nr:hypothetical protein [bacterium]
MTKTGRERKRHRMLRQRLDKLPLPTRGELRLLRKAVRHDWPIPTEKRPGLLRDVLHVMVNSHPRQSLAAVKVLIEMDSANLRNAR